MSLNETPRSSRTHIAIFGNRNAGKSSLINSLTGQNLSIVSSVKGTTTDPVYKSIEILPLGPCVIIDTAGLDDKGELGELRIQKTLEVLNKTDIALLITDWENGITKENIYILDKIKEKKLPVILVINKSDVSKPSTLELESIKKEYNIPVVLTSAILNIGIDDLKDELIKLSSEEEDKFKLVGDLINPGDIVVLVTPIDKAAPKGRLILPQQQTIRDILESDAIAVVTKEHELKETLEKLNYNVKLVITDSQVFLKVAGDTPRNIPLTSFSILFARYKGDLEELVKGALAIDKLKDGDKILISEGCTHHKQSDDIGTVKIPRWLRSMTGKNIDFEYSAGGTFSEDVKKYALIVHCGACMLNEKEMKSRISKAIEYSVPIVNYGVLIAYVQGVLERVLEPFPLAKMTYLEGLNDN